MQTDEANALVADLALWVAQAGVHFLIVSTSERFAHSPSVAFVKGVDGAQKTFPQALAAAVGTTRQAP